MTRKAFLFGTVALAASIGAVAAQPANPLHAGGYAHRFVSKTPKGSQTLFDQNNNDAGYAVLSDDFDDGSDSQAADNFSVPAGFTWIVTQIDVTGVYFDGSGPASGQNVYFYKDKNSEPGKLIQEFVNLKGVDSQGSFAITLPGKGIKLKAGTYWLSVQARMDFACCGEWGWEVSTGESASRALRQTPVSFGPDLMFALKGKSRSAGAD